MSSRIIAGIDEAGRGCWAGPLVAAAVVLYKPLHGLRDSKLLARSQREDLAVRLESCSDIGISVIEPGEIDETGLTAATTKAMQLALLQLKSDYSTVIIDGNYNFLPHVQKAVTLVKADMTVPAVSAASIIAKVTRDLYMIKAAEDYPCYRFEKHVGYGTRLHLEMLQRYGACEIHRKSYKPISALL